MRMVLIVFQASLAVFFTTIVSTISGGTDCRIAASLVTIAARTARAAAKATSARIAQLQAAEKEPTRRQFLDLCAREYAAAVRRLGRAARDAAAGGDKLAEAATLLSDASGTPVRCDGAFVLWAGESSPLTDADRQVDDVIELALNLLWYPLHTGTK